MKITKLFLIFTLSIILAACSNQPQNRDGQSIYYQSCVSCHERGQGGAPIRGDTKAWQTRLKKGKEVLFNNLKDGYSTMPPKGACFDCTDKELQMVLEFVLQKEQ